MARNILGAYNQTRYFGTFSKKVEETTIGVPLETFESERRVALSPEAAQRLIKLGFKVNIQSGAGAYSDFSDSNYTAIGAKIVN